MPTQSSKYTLDKLSKKILVILQSLFYLVTFSFLLFIALLFYASVENAGGWYANLKAVAGWLDPTFTQYNLMLMSFSVIIIPLITFCYVVSMKGEKRSRLKIDFTAEEWKSCKHSIDSQLQHNFRFSNYIGSMTALTMIVILGSAILLLLKPLPVNPGPDVTGLNYNLGANFLMLGPYMQLYIENGNYTKQLITSLTAFQFGFLGAYIYFIGHLIRSYFTLDLTPNTFVISSVRMVTGAVLALVLSFSLKELPSHYIPMISFFLGFFPSRALLIMEKMSIKLLNFKGKRYLSAPLSQLPGMSYNHEIRLTREGYDNIENLAYANAVDLALRTGFGCRQLNAWIHQARLMDQLGEDYSDFVRITGIRNSHELAQFLGQDSHSEQTPLIDQLTQTMDERLAVKIRIVSTILTSGSELCAPS